jgi:hypothetical protein
MDRVEKYIKYFKSQAKADKEKDAVVPLNKDLDRTSTITMSVVSPVQQVLDRVKSELNKPSPYINEATSPCKQQRAPKRRREKTFETKEKPAHRLVKRWRKN